MHRYDDGCTGITNIDFSALVIKQMMAKNLRTRPRMRWQVMDMTQTKARSPADSCHAVMPSYTVEGLWDVCLFLCVPCCDLVLQ